MKNKTIFRNALTVVLLMACLAAFAQNNGPWKKTVYRTIDLKEKENKKKPALKDAGTSNLLVEILYDAVMKGKIQAYATYENNMTNIMSREDIFRCSGADKPDTVAITDPVTGTQTIKIIYKDPDMESFQKFRVLEEWTFNAATGKTEIQIIAIAPVKEIFGEDGSFRGEKLLFWIRYTDALPSIVKYDSNNPTRTFAMHIWDDYFTSDVKPKAAK